jgi:uncharacterized protein YeaO (DUF488 family)
MTPSRRARIKRVYDRPCRQDGRRILVDRLWPRGVSRETARIDDWVRELAPSARLRRWFGHDPTRWTEFQKRYRAELRTRSDRLAWLAGLARRGRITLIYAAKNHEQNNARALQRLVVARLKRRRSRRRATTR